jgi:lipoyl(octanoyl) transferase
MRRFVSSFGVGLNVSTDLWWFDRIVACGLEGKGTTSFVREGVVGVGVEEVGDRFVKAMAESFGCTSIGKKSRKDIPPDLLVEES